MAAQKPKAENPVGKIFRVSSSDNAKVKTPEMSGRLKEGEYVLCLEHKYQKTFLYAPMARDGAAVSLYPKAFHFVAELIGVRITGWEPTEDEYYHLRGMLAVRLTEVNPFWQAWVQAERAQPALPMLTAHGGE